MKKAPCISLRTTLTIAQNVSFAQMVTFEFGKQDNEKDLVCEFLVAGEAPSGSAVDKVL